MAHHLHYTDLTAEREREVEGRRVIERGRNGQVEDERGMDGCR